LPTYSANVLALVKRPSGFLPVVMSVAAVVIVVSAIAHEGTVRQPDEGAAAHLFQLLAVGELPVLAFFAAKWLRSDALAALTVLALQAVALALACFPVWYFGL
jgi:hypothetical protein